MSELKFYLLLLNKYFSASMKMITELIELYFVKLQFIVVIKIIHIVLFYQYLISFIYTVYCITLSVSISLFIYIFVFVFLFVSQHLFPLLCCCCLISIFRWGIHLHPPLCVTFSIHLSACLSLRPSVAHHISGTIHLIIIFSTLM